MLLQTNCLPNSNFCQFSIQIFCPFFAKFFLKNPIFCQLFAKFFANCLPIFCQFFARINFQKLLLHGIFFWPWMPYYQTFGQENWTWQTGEPNNQQKEQSMNWLFHPDDQTDLMTRDCQLFPQIK